MESRYDGNKRQQWLVLNEALVRRLEVDNLAILLDARQLPMIVPPRLWTDWDQGGFLTVDCAFFDLPD